MRYVTGGETLSHAFQSSCELGIEPRRSRPAVPIIYSETKKFLSHRPIRELPPNDIGPTIEQ